MNPTPAPAPKPAPSTFRARSFPGNPNDGHTLAEQIEQTTALLQDLGVKPTTAIIDLGFRGKEASEAPVELIRKRLAAAS